MVSNLAVQQRKNPEIQDYFPGLKLGDTLPHNFIRSNVAIDLSAIAIDTVIIASDNVPAGFQGKIQDINVNFQTTGTAVIKLVILDQGNQLVSNVTFGITDNTSGIANEVIAAGYRIGLMVQTAGTGTLRGVDFSGVWQYVGGA